MSKLHARLGTDIRVQKGCVVQSFPGPYTIGAQTFTPPELSDALSATEMAAMGAQWFVNYLPVSTILTSIPFVPMIFSRGYLSDANLIAAANQRIILGYNEPDRAPPQANLTPAEALADWHRFELAAAGVPGCRLGAPVTAGDPSSAGSWTEQFMAGPVPETGNPPVVNFIPLHYYTNDFANPATATTVFKNLILRTFAKFQLPCWVTEAGMINFTTPDPATWTYGSVAQYQAYIQNLIPMFLSLNFILERYAWYPNVIPAAFPSGDGNVYNEELADLTGALSAVGTTYRNTGNL